MTRLKRRYFVVLDLEREEGAMLDAARVGEIVASGVDYVAPRSDADATAYSSMKDLLNDAVHHAGPFEEQPSRDPTPHL